MGLARGIHMGDWTDRRLKTIFTFPTADSQPLMKYCFRSSICWIHRCERPTTEWKVIPGFSGVWRLAPLTSTLFKGQLYRDCKSWTGFGLPSFQVNRKLTVVSSLFLWEVKLVSVQRVAPRNKNRRISDRVWVTDQGPDHSITVCWV